jgi:uncharacterized 2Fe-2S/4Fe-4S cluster protein (DUF4445 family)
MPDQVAIELVPLGIRLSVERGAAFGDILAAYGVEFPCGGSDLCGGCRIRVLEGVLQARIEDRCTFSEEKIAQGWRLACRARAEAPLKIEIGQWAAPVLTDSSRLEGGGRTGLGIAIDLGTTTIAAQMLDLATGEVLGVSTALNPQGAHGADVMSRVLFALSNPGLTSLIRDTIGDIVVQLAGSRRDEMDEIVLVGNTVMHHLFAGIAVEPLSHSPFAPQDAGEQQFSPAQLSWDLPESCRIRFLPCIGGFVGSDILAGIIAVGLAADDALCALIDLGTNGEIVLGNRHRILCASTAAGPAFEAASIKMGMRAAVGAISHVFLRETGLECHVIGDVRPRGICGSGLVDAVAAGLEGGSILLSGQLADGAREISLKEPVSLAQADIRELQLAKAAIASGMRLMLNRWGGTHHDIQKVHLAGAFGNYVRIESASRIGLLEVAPCKIVSAGNTALRGAKMVLLSPVRPPLPPMEHIPLASEPNFQNTFIDCLSFPDFSH